jgi:arylsulfatase A-like enzyme
MLPEVLRAAGYRTMGVSPNSWMSDEFGVTHGFDAYLKLWQGWHTMPSSAPAAPKPLSSLGNRLNRLYSRYVFPWRNRAQHVRHHIEKLLATTPEPFFLYAIYWDMHLPYYPRGRHAIRWLPAEIDPRQAQRVNRNHLAYLTEQTPMSDEDFTVLRALYDGALATIDEEIGALVAGLRQRGMLERTLLIITSDHGENIGEHGLMSHAYSLHDTLIHVPLIIRYPEYFSPGERITHQVQLIDLFPTLLDAARLDLPQVRRELQGMSLLTSPPEAMTERLAYAEMLAPHPSIEALNRRAGAPDKPRPAFDRALRCLRTPNTKVIWASDGHHAFYDLQQDPHETTNRIADEPERAMELLQALQAWHPSSRVLHNQPIPKLDLGLRQRLRNLGYID